jgi:hypothetical protein
LNVKPELQWQILNKNIGQNILLGVLFLDFPYVSSVNEAPDANFMYFESL